MKTITASGSPSEIGRAIGRQGTLFFRWFTRRRPPLDPATAAAFARRSWEITRGRYPAIAGEIEGVAEGAGVPLERLLLSLCEELWDSDDHQPDVGCTDVVARGAKTANGNTLLGHTNDASASQLGPAIIQILPDDGRPASVGVSMDGYAPACGRNGAGVILTGNQLTAGDVRPGVPRLVLARAVLDQPTIERAVDVCLDPHRASSYNNILADRRGTVIDLEGSATRTAVVPFSDDLLVHTNHYLMPGMRDIERKWEQASTRMRLDVGREMADALAPHTPQSIARILASHDGGRDSICRHDEETRTFFATIYEAETGILWLSDGPPCLQNWQLRLP